MPDQFPIVGTDNDSGALFIDLGEEAHYFEGQLGVEVSRWLIGQNDFGMIDNGSSYGYTLLFSVGEMGGVFPHFVIEVNHAEGVEYFPSQFLSGESQHLENDGDIVENSFVKEQTKVLEDYSHRPSQIIDFVVRDAQYISSTYNDLTVSGKNLPENDLQKG